MRFFRNRLGGSNAELRRSPSEEANFSNVATALIGFRVEGRPMPMVSHYCFSSPRGPAAEAVISFQVKPALLGPMGRKLSLRQTELPSRPREGLFGQADLKREGVFLKVPIDS